MYKQTTNTHKQDLPSRLESRLLVSDDGSTHENSSKGCGSTSFDLSENSTDKMDDACTSVKYPEFLKKRYIISDGPIYDNGIVSIV